MVNKKATTPTPRSSAVPQRKPRVAASEQQTGQSAAARGGAVAKPATPQRAAPPRQQAGRFEGVQRGIRETIAELKKVQWPDRLTTRNLTLVVIGMSAALAAILGLLDAGLTRIIQWLVQLPIGG